MFTLLARIAITIMVVRLLTGWIDLLADRHNLESLSLLRNLLNGLAFVVVLLVVLASLGLPVNGLIIALAGSTVVLSLALQQPLTNLFGGLVLAASNRFKQGDFIRLNTGEEGYIIDVDWFTTTMRQMENNVIDVPNATMVMAVVANYSRPNQEVQIYANVAVGRKEDIDRVEQVTLEVAAQVMKEVPGGVPGWQPVIRYPQGLADLVTRFVVVLRVKNYEVQYPVMYEFFRRLQERYRQEGISVPFPFGADYQPEKLSERSSRPS